jgi:hypothetical protein
MHSRRTAAIIVPFVGMLLVASAGAAQYRRAFVTSVWGDANFAAWPDAEAGTSGADAADSICRARAAAAGLANAEIYRAWISDSLDDAWCRVQGLAGRRDSGCDGAPTLPGAGPWALVGSDVLWAESLEALTSERGPMLPLDRTELGTPIHVGDAIWTGTDETGRAFDPFGSSYCQDWTAATTETYVAAGAAYGTRPAWTAEYAAACVTERPLFCLEGASTAAEPPVATLSPAALAFVTDATGSADFGSWPQAGGLAGVEAADAICRAEATAHHLPHPDEFVAFVATGSTSVRDRLPAGLGWVRLDGERIATSVDDLLDGSLGGPISITPSGRTLPELGSAGGAVWTGIAADGTPAEGLDCAGWTDGGDTEMALIGRPDTVAANWTDAQPTTCAAELPIYCLGTVELLFWSGFETGSAIGWALSEE